MATPARETSPQTGRGWGVAAIVVISAIVINSLVFWYHTKTYKHPVDIEMRAKGSSSGGGH